jgi:hypothetical protein
MKMGLILALGLLAAPCAAQQFAASDDEVQAYIGADRNGDGVLSFPEFRVFVQSMARGGQPTARQIRFFGAYRYAFGIADADGNGVVTPIELRTGDDTHRATP